MRRSAKSSGSARGARRLDPDTGKTAIMFGAGIIGISAAIMRLWYGCPTVMAVDRSDSRLANARRFGLATCNPAAENLLAKAQAEFGGQATFLGEKCDAEILAMMRSGRWDLSALVTQGYAIDPIADAPVMGAGTNAARKVCIAFWPIGRARLRHVHEIWGRIMSIIGLDHINIRTRDPGATMRFFRDVLQMKIVLPAGSDSADRGGFVLDEMGAAVLHVSGADQVFPGDERRPFVATDGSGAIDHVALRCSDYADTKERLDTLRVPFWENYVEQVRLRQIFVEDPAGIKFELGFPEA